MQSSGEKLRVTVDIHDRFPGASGRVFYYMAFEGEFATIASQVMKFLGEVYCGNKGQGIGATVTGGIVPFVTPLNEEVEMKHLRQNPSLFPPHPHEVNSEAERELLRILGFADATTN